MTQAISTREGWSAFVSESLDKPISITRAELDALGALLFDGRVQRPRSP